MDGVAEVIVMAERAVVGELFAQKGNRVVAEAVEHLSSADAKGLVAACFGPQAPFDIDVINEEILLESSPWGSSIPS